MALKGQIKKDSIVFYIFTSLVNSIIDMLLTWCIRIDWYLKSMKHGNGIQIAHILEITDDH